MPTSVKYLHSAMTGAPTLSGTAGAHVAVLDACLVNGFGSGTVDSLVVASGVATVTRAAGHPFEVGTVATIAGATVTGGTINGEQRVLSVSTTTYTFDATGISNQTATGTITHKLAALGWTKAFSGTNLGVYTPSDVAALGMYLRVDDTGTLNARCVGYETMSDANTGTGLFPLAAQVSGGLYWPKAHNTSGTRAWFLWGDTRAFHLWVAPHSTQSTNGIIASFGDLKPVGTADLYAAIHSAPAADHTAFSSAVPACLGTASNGNATFYMPRAYNAIGGSRATHKLSSAAWANSSGNLYSGSSSYSNISVAYPNGPDNALNLADLMSISDGALRGTIPGIYHTAQTVVAAFNHLDPIDATGTLADRKLVALRVGAPGVLSTAGVVFADVTGPWR